MLIRGRVGAELKKISIYQFTSSFKAINLNKYRRFVFKGLNVDEVKQ